MSSAVGCPNFLKDIKIAEALTLAHGSAKQGMEKIY